MRDPRLRRALAVVLLVGSLIGWPATHVMILVTHPPEASWVFHMLLALSWLALTLTALDILATTDVRVQAEEDDRA